jgi:hypothetical protein
MTCFSQPERNGHGLDCQGEANRIPHQLITRARTGRGTGEPLTASYSERQCIECFQAKRLQALEVEMEAANAEYIQAVNRASEFASLMNRKAGLTKGAEDLHSQMSQFLRRMLEETNTNNIEPL